MHLFFDRIIGEGDKKDGAYRRQLEYFILTNQIPPQHLQLTYILSVAQRGDHVAKLFANSSALALTSFISSPRVDRDLARSIELKF